MTIGVIGVCNVLYAGVTNVCVFLSMIQDEQKAGGLGQDVTV